MTQLDCGGEPIGGPTGGQAAGRHKLERNPTARQPPDGRARRFAAAQHRRACVPPFEIIGFCGVALFFAGEKQFEKFNPLPDRSLEALKENVECLTNPKECLTNPH